MHLNLDVCVLTHVIPVCSKTCRLYLYIVQSTYTCLSVVCVAAVSAV